jgi:hypothetical protein
MSEQPQTLTNFGVALAFLKTSVRVTRQAWITDATFLELVYTEPDSKHSGPLIQLNTVRNEPQVWEPTQTDLLAEDWYAIPLP